MRISGWSSDVCSSDLKLLEIKLRGFLKVGQRLLDGFALGGSASLGIEGNETAFFGGDQDGGELHGAASRRRVIVPLVHEGWDGEKLAASAAPTTACALQERRKPRAFRRRRAAIGRAHV